MTDIKQEIVNAMDQQTQTITETPEAPMFKVGEKEYSQADLDRYVKLGEIGAEAEEKYGVTIDKVWPNHQRTINEKLALEQELKSLRETQAKQPATEAQQSEAEIEKQVRDAMSKYGYKTETETRQIIQNELNGQRLIADTQSVINDMAASGYPSTTVEDLFTFMSDPANPKDPKQAYKLMFEEQIDKVKEEKIRSLKGPGLVTSSSSTAGSKAPAPQKITGQNLRDALAAALPD